MTSAVLSGEQAIQRFADQKFRFRVDARSGFIKNQEARIVRQSASEADQLPLSDGKRGARVH